MKHFFCLLFILLVAGCAGRIRDFDPEKEELARAKKYKQELNLYEPTPSVVTVGRRDNVEVIVEKSIPLKESEFVERDVWLVSVANTNNEPRCVMLVWKLMDFEYISNEPARFLIPANRQKHVGTMLSKVWDFNGFKVVPPASGYLFDMFLSRPNLEAKKDEECVIVDKKKIEEK